MALPIPIPKAVTFDCWQTLMVEVDVSTAREVRLEALARCARDAGRALSKTGAGEVLDAAWRRHWQRKRLHDATGAGEIARWALESMKLPNAVVDRVAPELQREFAEASLASEIRALPGALATLETLERAGIRRALICDTGFNPGRTVRQLLARLGLLDLLEVHVFSDEVGVAKPHPLMFERALSALDLRPVDAVHVGDLRHTDIAGARAVGMATIRIRDSYDDSSKHPEADAVADSHAHLCEILAEASGRFSRPERTA